MFLALLLLSVPGVFAAGRRPPPIVAWRGLDSGESIVLDVPFMSYGEENVYAHSFAANFDSYTLALRLGIAAALGGAQANIVDFFEMPNAGTRVVLNLMTANSSARDQFNSLFCATRLRPGAPACPRFLAQLRAEGLPVAGAYYQNFTGPSQWTPALVQAKSAARVATFDAEDVGEVVCFDLPIANFSARRDFHVRAAELGFETALGLPPGRARISWYAAPAGSAAGTCVWVNFVVYTSGVSSDYVVRDTAQSVMSLFSACEPSAPPGCAADPIPIAPLRPLVGALQSFGLSITQAYYNEMPV